MFGANKNNFWDWFSFPGKTKQKNETKKISAGNDSSVQTIFGLYKTKNKNETKWNKIAHIFVFIKK